MPYFVDENNCVRKGTKEEPGEQVKCHEDHAKAVAHMRALYSNVEDAKALEEAKGGRGSGWHNPPEGTHTAENAPNFAGGPGADRKYGTESDEPPEGSKRCKCSKCGAVIVLPKGKQCEDIKCPACGAGSTQEVPREDKPAKGEEGRGGGGGKKALSPTGTGNVHGEGSMLGEVASVMGEDAACKCPHCGKGLPCTAKACPHCKEKIDKVDRGEGDKSFVSYKSDDGTWRWMTLSSWAVVDKEREVVSEQAYQDAIAYAQKNDAWGEMDLVHVDGTDVGDADMLFIVKGGNEPAKLGAGGTWYDTEKATRAREVIQAEPEHWGVSLKFRFNPDRLIRGVYTGDIQVLKHSILPQEMAASYGTAVAVQEANQMSKELDEKARVALAKLGHTPEEIAELAEKQKALLEEENVVEKEETTEAAPERETLWAQLGKALGIGSKEVVPEASTPDEARKAEEEVPVPAVKQAVEDPPEAEKAEQPDAGALMQALGETVAKSVGEMVKKELDERDKRISELETLVKALGESVEEKVEQRLQDVPPVVKISASSIAAPVADGAPGFTFGRQPAKQNDFLPTLMKSISEAVEDTMGSSKFQA